MELFLNTNFDFMKFRYKTYIISAVLILVGIISIISKGGLKYGVDFEGGTLVEIKFSKKVKIDEIRNTLAKINLSDSVIQQFGAENEILIRARNLKISEKEASQIDKKIEQVLKENFGQVNPFQVQRVEYVGPTVGKNLTSDTLMAVLLSMVGILIYVAYRFEFKYSFGGILALVHDVLVTIGCLSLLNREISISVVAAILTLIGYSINDTIVIFDRIREKGPLLRKKNLSLSEIINISVNATLSRTIITSLATFLSVLSIYLFGGEVLKDFSLTLLIGIITGSYSTIYIASPILIDYERFTKK